MMWWSPGVFALELDADRSHLGGANVLDGVAADDRVLELAEVSAMSELRVGVQVFEVRDRSGLDACGL